MKLCISRASKSLQQIGGSVSQLPNLFQWDTQPFLIQIVDPTGALTTGNQWTYPNLAASTLLVSIGVVSNGVQPASLYAVQNAWTWQPAPNSAFVGSIALDTNALLQALANSPQCSATFEVKLITGGIPETLLEAPITIQAAINQAGTSVAPTPVDTYLTKAQSIAMFVQYLNAAGQTVTFVSPNGAHQREIGVDNNGQPIDNET